VGGGRDGAGNVCMCMCMCGVRVRGGDARGGCSSRCLASSVQRAPEMQKAEKVNTGESCHVSLSRASQVQLNWHHGGQLFVCVEDVEGCVCVCLELMEDSANGVDYRGELDRTPEDTRSTGSRGG